MSRSDCNKVQTYTEYLLDIDENIFEISRTMELWSVKYQRHAKIISLQYLICNGGCITQKILNKFSKCGSEYT